MAFKHALRCWNQAISESKFDEAREFSAHRLARGDRVMLTFAARHNVVPQTDYDPPQDIHAAFERIDACQASYHVVLNADF